MPRRRPTLSQRDMFAAPEGPAQQLLAPDVVLLRQFALTPPVVAAIERLAELAPFRHLRVPGGGRMSVAMTNCGAVGWHSDARGYRYVEQDPLSGLDWPAMPREFRSLAESAALEAGFGRYAPDCCLVNRYAVGAQMGTHRDFDELDMSHPIVSVSIGLPAVFVWHGATRRGWALEVVVRDGDVLVWGRAARAGYHGVRRLLGAPGAAAGAVRYNLTFRRAR
jgi:DNA oxidative demethylase